MVFVEVKRDDNFFELTEKVVDDLGNIMDIDGWKYKPIIQMTSLIEKKVGRSM